MKNYVKRNWSKYNRNLVNRGRVTFWIKEETLSSWLTKSGRKGRPSFSTSVIQAGLIIKSVYNLPLRSLQGFLESLLLVLKVSLKSPHYSLFCKRAKEAASCLPKLSNRKPLELAIDSSGLKIRGEGEWKVKIHGSEQRRGWIKLHVGVDPKTQELIAIKVTDEQTADSAVLPDLINNAPKSLRKVYADGAYDRKNCRTILNDLGIEECIPPRKDGKIKEESGLKSRNDALKIIKGLGSDDISMCLWKKLSNYHRRSLVETVFSRFKSIFGDRLNAKKFTNLEAEINFKCYVLNQMLRA